MTARPITKAQETRAAALKAARVRRMVLTKRAGKAVVSLAKVDTTGKKDG